MNKTYIRTFNSIDAKIHDVELNGGSDDVLVALFCARRAVAVDGFAVILTQNAAVVKNVIEGFLDGCLSALANGQGGNAWPMPCKALSGWTVVKVYSEGAAERASDSPIDVVDEVVWDLVQWVDYRECRYYAESVDSL